MIVRELIKKLALLNPEARVTFFDTEINASVEISALRPGVPLGGVLEYQPRADATAADAEIVLVGFTTAVTR